MIKDPSPQTPPQKAPSPKSGIGPTRGELKFRLVFSLAGLAMLAAVVVFRGVPNGPALVEVVGIAGAFFGGTAGWTLWKLFHSD